MAPPSNSFQYAICLERISACLYRVYVVRVRYTPLWPLNCHYHRGLIPLTILPSQGWHLSQYL